LNRVSKPYVWQDKATGVSISAYAPYDDRTRWYVKECSVKGIVGMCERSLPELRTTVARLLPKLGDKS